MIRLTGFELGKIWGKKRFLLSCLILLALDFFLLWYTNLPGESRAMMACTECDLRINSVDRARSRSHWRGYPHIKHSSVKSQI